MDGDVRVCASARYRFPVGRGVQPVSDGTDRMRICNRKSALTWSKTACRNCKFWIFLDIRRTIEVGRRVASGLDGHIKLPI